MGAWGFGSFENDDAGDFLSEVAESADLSMIREAFDRALASTEYLEAPEGSQVIAAAEIVAAAMGRPSPEAQEEEELTDWLSRVRPEVDAELVARAGEALERVLGENSELWALWEEVEEFPEWQAAVTALRQRLRGEG